MEPIPAITKKNYLVLQQEHQLASDFSFSNINSVNSNHIFTFVEKNGHTKNVFFGRLAFLIKKLTFSKLMAIRNYVSIVEEMVTP